MPRASRIAASAIRHTHNGRHRMALLTLRAYANRPSGLEHVANEAGPHLYPTAGPGPHTIAAAAQAAHTTLPRWLTPAVIDELDHIDEPANGPWSAERLMARIWVAHHIDQTATPATIHPLFDVAATPVREQLETSQVPVTG